MCTLDQQTPNCHPLLCSSLARQGSRASHPSPRGWSRSPIQDSPILVAVVFVLVLVVIHSQAMATAPRRTTKHAAECACAKHSATVQQPPMTGRKSPHESTGGRESALPKASLLLTEGNHLLGRHRANENSTPTKQQVGSSTLRCEFTGRALSVKRRGAPKKPTRQSSSKDEGNGGTPASGCTCGCELDMHTSNEEGEKESRTVFPRHLQVSMGVKIDGARRETRCLLSHLRREVPRSSSSCKFFLGALPIHSVVALCGAVAPWRSFHGRTEPPTGISSPPLSAAVGVLPLPVGSTFVLAAA